MVCTLATVSSAWAHSDQGAGVRPAPASASPSPDFTASPRLQGAVDFWTELFVEHGHDQVVVVDRDHLQVVWQVLDLPKNSRGRVDEAAAQRLIRAQVAELRARLQRLQANTTPLDEVDRRLLLAAAAAPAVPVAEVLHNARERIRTQRGVADDFRAGTLRARPYLSRMRKIFAAQGVPEDLVALPFVESMFNPKARSAAGAVGLWQLMPKTARSLGLVVGRRRDDRRDVLLASRAAARLLRANHRALGTWPLAVTAYNHGATSLRRAVAELGTQDLDALIEHYHVPTWGFSSQNFYAEFLAARALVRDGAAPKVALAKTARR